MPVFQVGIFSLSDLGVPPYVFGPTTFPPIYTVVQLPNQTYTIPVGLDADTMFVDDDEANFEDEQDDVQTSTGDIGDPNLNQALDQDLFVDGVQVGSAGDSIWTVASSTFVNNTTGEVGTLYYVSNNQNPFPNTSVLSDIIGVVTDIAINPGDSVTIGPINPVAAVPYDDLICFAAGTLIKTSKGPRKVEKLEVGDLVKTPTGSKSIKYIGHRHLTSFELLTQKGLYPIEIDPFSGVLEGLERPIRVSPQHRFLISSPLNELYFENTSVFVTAKSLLGRAGVREVTEVAAVDYYHFALEDHSIVFAEGARTESLYLGPGYTRFHTPEALCELERIFPDLPIDPERVHRCIYPTLKQKEVGLLLSK